MSRPLRWQVCEGLPLALENGGRLEVTADAIARDSDGKIVVARHRFGRTRKSHKEKHNADRHTLFAAAVREIWPDTPVTVVLHYLLRDETVIATPSNQVISRCVKKLKVFAEEIAEGNFPAKPGQECKSRNWNLVCPSSA